MRLHLAQCMQFIIALSASYAISMFISNCRRRLKASARLTRRIHERSSDSIEIWDSPYTAIYNLHNKKR